MSKSLFVAGLLGLAGLTAACTNMEQTDRVGAELAASDARLATCLQQAGVTGSYTVKTHIEGPKVYRSIVPGPGVTETQGYQVNGCLAG